ncbi:hypothetical protein CLOP_g8 [Closterium sp. NIES-67]|nr:hypothetical protein CLOP_g8 [Closterium sp. NIES-67]
MASCRSAFLSLRAPTAPPQGGPGLSPSTRRPHAFPAASPQSYRTAADVSTPRGGSRGPQRAPTAAAWGRRESSGLRAVRISAPHRSAAVGTEGPGGQQQRGCATRAGKAGFGEGGGRGKSKGKGKGKGKEKEKGKRNGEGKRRGENETVTVALHDEGADVGDMSEAELEAAIEALFAQLASDLEADADVDGTGFAAGDADVELDEDELAALQAELDAALAEMTAEVEREEGEGEGEVDEEERALVAELGLEEEEEEGEDDDEGEEEEEMGEWEGGMGKQTEAGHEGAELAAKGLREDGRGEAGRGEAGRGEEGGKDGGLRDVVEVITGVAGAGAVGAGAVGAGAVGAGAVGGAVMGRRDEVEEEARVTEEKGQGLAGADKGGAARTREEGAGEGRGKRKEKQQQEGVPVGESDEDDWEEEVEEGEAEEEEGSVARGGARREVQLQRWQLKKLALAVQKGRRHINVKALAAEAHLPRRDVLAFLRHPPDISALFPDLPSPAAPDSSPRAPADGAGAQEGAVAGQSGGIGGEGEEKGAGEKGGGEGKGADRLGMSEEGKKEWQERWMKGKRIRQEHLSTLEAVYQRSKYPTNTVVANLVSVTHLPRRRILQWFEDRRARTETGRAHREMRGTRR